MANLTTVVYTAGVLNASVAGTVSTVDALLASGLPITQGGNTAAVKAASTAPLATDPALVVAISPNSINPNGQTLMSASAPVVIASNQSAIQVTVPLGQSSMAASTPVVVASNQSTIPIGGAVATNVAITDNPINNGAQAVSSENAAVTTSRKVQLVADLVGKLITLPYSNPENFLNGNASIIGTTSTVLIAAQSGSNRIYVTDVLVTNSSPSVSSFIQILDGTATIWNGYAVFNGGGWAKSFLIPLRGTAATALNVQATTSVGSPGCVICVSAYKGV